MRTFAFAAALAACSSHAPTTRTTPEPAEIAPPTEHAPRETPPPTLRLPTSFAPRAYRAHLKLDPTQPRFDGELAIDATLAAPSAVIWLDADTLTIDRAEAIVGATRTPLTATAVAHFVGLRAAAPLPAGPVTVQLAYHGEVSDQDTRGAWRRQWDGQWYAFTQFEPIAARRVFPCVDEPSTKVPWQLTLDVPSGDVALSNTAGTRRALDGKTDRWEFAPTRPLPSYLVAFAVGPFAIVDAGKTPGGKPIRIATPARRGADASYAAKTTPAIVAKLEAYFGSPFPYDKLDEVATAGYGGAMENAGMITYGEQLILIDPADPSRARRLSFDSVGAHEIAHHWFGDLVTTAWWDDLWLNEAFATWMQDKMTAELDPDAHGELYAVGTLTHALDADDLGSARMIRQPIKSEGDIDTAFDGITYGKGASVIRMFERWVEPAKFQAGVRAYLAAHVDKNATADDFLDAIGEAAGKDVKTPFDTFLDQAGAPRITATLTCARGERAKVALHQERYLPRGAAATAGGSLWQVPVCVVYGDERGKPARECTLLTAADGAMELAAGACPSWLYANADATGYYRVALAPDALAALIAKGWSKLGSGERLALAADVWSMVEHGDVDAGVALDLVPKLVAEKTSFAVQAAAQLGARLEPYVPAAQRAAYQAWIRKTYGPLAASLGWTAKPGEDDETQQLRRAVVPLVATTGADPALRKDAVALAVSWQKLPSAIAPSVLAAAIDDATTFEALLAQAHGITDRIQQGWVLDALARVHDPARLARVFALALDPSYEWAQVVGLPAIVSADPASRAAGAAYAREHEAELEARVPEPYRAYLAPMMTFDCDAATRDAAIAKAEGLRRYVGGVRRVDQAAEALDECIAQKALIAPALARYFGKVK